MTPDQAMTKAIARTPSLVQLDAAESDIIAAARVVADLPIPAIDLSSTEAMVERDHLIAAMEDLRDAIQRADGTAPWEPWRQACNEEAS